MKLHIIFFLLLHICYSSPVKKRQFVGFELALTGQNLLDRPKNSSTSTKPFKTLGLSNKVEVKENLNSSSSYKTATSTTTSTDSIEQTTSITYTQSIELETTLENISTISTSSESAEPTRTIETTQISTATSASGRKCYKPTLPKTTDTTTYTMDQDQSTTTALSSRRKCINTEYAHKTQEIEPLHDSKDSTPSYNLWLEDENYLPNVYIFE